MTSPHLITDTGGGGGGGGSFLALDGSNQASWTPTSVLVPNLNADLLDGKNTGTSGNTIPLLDGVNTWSNGQTFNSTVNILGVTTLATSLDGLATLTAGVVGERNGVQGDLPYFSGTNVVAVLNKNTSATRYLSNTGASNNPAWALVDLSNGTTGTLPGPSVGAAGNQNEIQFNNGGVLGAASTFGNLTVLEFDAAQGTTWINDQYKTNLASVSIGYVDLGSTGITLQLYYPEGHAAQQKVLSIRSDDDVSELAYIDKSNAYFPLLLGTFASLSTGAVTGTSFTGTTLALTADSAQIVLDSDSATTTTLQDSASGSSKTITFPNSTTTLGGLATAQTWTALNTFTGGVTITTANLTITDRDVVLSTTTGTKFGTATNQKLGFYNATPVVQTTGSTDVLAGLVTVGLRAASSNPPLNLGSGTLTAGIGNFSGNITISKATPSLIFTDSGGDDYSETVTSGTYQILNTTDSRNILSSDGAGVTTLGAATSGTTLTYNVATGSSHTFQVNSASIGTWNATAFSPVVDININKATPSLIWTDSGGDDYSATVTTGTWALLNTTDSRNILSTTGAGVTTLGAATAGTTLTYNVATGAAHTFQVNSASIGTWDSAMHTSLTDITISKAIPAIFLTDSGGNDYAIDVGSTANLLRIRNVSTGSTIFAADTNNRVAVSTNYGPQANYKFYAQDRITDPAWSAAYAALGSQLEFLPSGNTTGAANLHGYQGGLTVFANTFNVNSGYGFFGLRGDTSVFLDNSKTCGAATGLFGSVAAYNFGTGGTLAGAYAISSFISCATGCVITEAAHIRIGSDGGPIATLYGIKCSEKTSGTVANYEIWLDTGGGVFWREAGNQMYSSAAATLDEDATTTMNKRIGGTIKLVLTSSALTFSDAVNIAVNGTTGTKIGTATSQKLSLWNATPIVQPTTAVAAATFVANAGTAVNDASTFDGYTMGQVVKALRNIGVLA